MSGRGSKSSSLVRGKLTKEVDVLRQNEVDYKSRIKSLEVELDTLKHRLDSLRKAKHTTIIKRDREQIRLSSPKLGRHHSSAIGYGRPSTTSIQVTTGACQHGNLPSQIEELRRQVSSLDRDLLSERASHDKHCQELTIAHTKEMAGLKERTVLEIKQLKDKLSQMLEDRTTDTVVCQKYEALLPEFDKLRTENRQLAEKLEEMLTINQKLRDSNVLLQGKCETLLDDLSVKEARWSEREDALKAEIRKQWGERYQEWMVKAEKKMEELQQVNTLLQGMLRTKQHHPDL